MIKPKILITGITGFVGLHLLEEIKKKKLEQQYDFRVLLRKPIILPNFIQIFKGDLRNLNVLHSALEESNIIIHLASILDSSNKNLQHVNIKSSANIINTMKQDSKIIFLSSITVNYQDKTKYSNSKLVVENLIKKTCKHYTIIRPSWIYGNNSRSFEKLLSLIKQSLFIPIIKNKIQPVFVNDISKIILDSIEQYDCQIIEIGGEKIEYKNFVKVIAHYFKKKPIIVILPFAFFKLIYQIFKIFRIKILTKDSLIDFKHETNINLELLYEKYKIKPKNIQEILKEDLIK